MSKSFRNPFGANPFANFSPPSDPNALRPVVTENRAGIRRVPQRNNIYQPVQRQSKAQDDVYAYRRGAGSPSYQNGSAVYGAVADGGNKRTINTAKNRNKDAAVNTGIKTAGKCADEASKSPDVRSRRKQVDYSSMRLDFTEENLLKGFVMAEVLGKPKCLRRGRW